MIALNPEQLVFVTERHLATLTTLRADGSPHVVPVAFMWDQREGVARVVTERASAKVRNVTRAGAPARAALCQVDGGRWITLEGVARISADPGEIALAQAGHARRYHRLEPDPDRVVLRLLVDRVLASDYMA